MSSAHTDAELLLSAQIAYLNITPGPGGHSRSIKDWMDSTYKTLNSSDPADKCQMDAIDNIRSMLASEEYSGIDFDSWMVVDACDHNGGSGSGMYSMLIDTGDGDAVIAFRGSENYDTEQMMKDWGCADAGLFNNTLTGQQADAQEYARRVMEKYGDRYDSFDVTGHSLGGNLAEHAAITIAEEYREKIGRAVNFDGPGFSDEYIIAHAAGIAAMADKVEHDAWSIVGSLLIPLPGTKYQVIDAATPDGDLMARHTITNVTLKDGHVVEGERDPLAEGAYYVSKVIEIAATSVLSIQISAALLVLSYGIQVLGNGINWIIEQIKELFAEKVEYTVQTAALGAVTEELSDLARLENRVSEEVMQIGNGIIYESMGGCYCKNKIRNIAGAIACDADASRRLERAVSNCRQRYEDTDGRAASALSL